MTDPSSLSESIASPLNSASRAAMSRLWSADELALLGPLLDRARLPPAQAAAVQRRAADWVRRLRASSAGEHALDAFMQEYDLSSEEGVLLMCLAEALLRIPDDDTAEALIADKLSLAHWDRHLGHSRAWWVNASTWTLMLSGRLIRSPTTSAEAAPGLLARLVERSSEPVVRGALRQAMRLMGQQFVMGRNIGEALQRARRQATPGECHSFDMLGEAALSQHDADRYLQAYRQAIEAIGADGRAPSRSGRPGLKAGLSVKLSALHPRYEWAQRSRVLAQLQPRLFDLAQRACAEGIALTVDAEEADRLELSLDLLLPLFREASLAGWNGLGLAVQAYQKRSLALIDHLREESRRARRHLQVRLVKGAYWDSEIKRSQELGLPDYPVFTRKAHTDVAYLACARLLLASRDVFYPMFATHNAHTVAAISLMAGDSQAETSSYEFQRLQGMGEALYRQVQQDLPVRRRVYAPVGSHEALLPYLVRRLLENGANSSFVNRLFDRQLEPEALVLDPVAEVESQPLRLGLPLPGDLYAAERRASLGLNLADAAVLDRLDRTWSRPIPAETGESLTTAGRSREALNEVRDPADRRRLLGGWRGFDPAGIADVVDAAVQTQPSWAGRPVGARADLLEAAADAVEADRDEFMRLLIREAGKTLVDAVAEVREAVDFLRYYAAQARALLGKAQVMPGPTGEYNELQLHPRGVFACISPWNFPLAIFTGQVAAALVCGNAVVAKPAEQTSLIALRMTRLMHRVGVPPSILQLLLGAGEIGAALCADERLAGVVFTGSLEVAQAINRQLAARAGGIAVLIAETGGQNAMIVDSSALPEQVVKDVIGSAFLSAGQRCSALRVLYLQDEIAGPVIDLLKAALRERVLGDPMLVSTDIGPVIDAAALARLETHVDWLRARGAIIDQLPLPATCAQGSFFPPTLAAVSGIQALEGEVFGPILHVARFAADDLDRVVDDVNRSGYGLTLGVHSRIESTWRRVQARARVGLCYVNRGMTGAMVGSQPFGGEGRSGTGPKAGGPHYLLRFLTERVLSLNTAAIGGNAQLLARGKVQG